MPKKKPMEVSKEFIEQVLAIIANETKEGREKIVAIARRAENKYELPVRSWITGWIYQYTRTRGEKVDQSINVMENFPDAYTRLQEFKLMISEGEWNAGSYNYYLFLELIAAVPDYQPLDESIMPVFITELKEQVLKQINSFMAQYKAVLEDVKVREMERQAARENARQLLGNVVVFNNLEAAKASLSKRPDKTTFTLSYKNSQWQLFWVDATGEVYPLTPGEELAQKLETLNDPDIEKLNPVHLRRIKGGCLKSREQYLTKVQVHINPHNINTHVELSNDDLVAKGITSAFVVRFKEKVARLWWINSIGVANEISLTDHPRLTSWLASHQDSYSEADIMQLKAFLLQLNTAQSIATSKLEKMNTMLSKVLGKKDKQFLMEKNHSEPVDAVQAPGKLDPKGFAFLEEHMKTRVEKMAPKKLSHKEEASEPSEPLPPLEETVAELQQQKLSPKRYEALSQLPTFWERRKIAMEQLVQDEIRPLTPP